MRTSTPPDIASPTTRKRIGMVFQKPNPFPAMSIADNVAGRPQPDRHQGQPSASGTTWSRTASPGPGCGTRSRTGSSRPGSALSGGQQQRLCIARALAVGPEVLLMDEPCSALDPTSTRRIEETIAELRNEVTIVIVTHNMQQAARVSQQAAFFLAEQGTPGGIVESGPTEQLFEQPGRPADRRLRERAVRMTVIDERRLRRDRAACQPSAAARRSDPGLEPSTGSSMAWPRTVGLFVLVITGAIGVFLGYQSIPTLRHYGLHFFTQTNWQPELNKIGIAAVLVGTARLRWWRWSSASRWR